MLQVDSPVTFAPSSHKMHKAKARIPFCFRSHTAPHPLQSYIASFFLQMYKRRQQGYPVPADTNPIRSPPDGTAVFYSENSAVAFLTHCFTPYKMKSTTSAGGAQMQATFSSYAGTDPSE